jgi:hypothetical protein
MLIIVDLRGILAAFQGCPEGEILKISLALK